MSRTVLADTGPLYAAIDPDDAWHARAREDLASFGAASYDVLVPYSTLLEAYSLVLYKLGGHVARRWLAELTDQALLVNPAPEDYRAAWERLGRYADQPLSLFDSVLAVVSERLQLPIWTFDHHFDLLRVQVWRPGG